MSNIILQQVTTQDELDKIYALRYEIYKNVLHVDIPCMHHDTKQLREDVDKKSIILAAFFNKDLVGTIRGTTYKNLSADEIFLDKHYHIFNYQDACRENSAEVARFCVLKEYQKYGISALLLKEMLQMGLKDNKNLKYIFLETLGFLVEYYKYFHFKPCSAPFLNPDYKLTMHPMVLEVKDAIAQFNK